METLLDYELSIRTQRLLPPPINWLIQYDLEHPEVISLAAGLVDYPTLPTESLNKNLSEFFNKPGVEKNLQYGTTQGHEGLRKSTVEVFNSLEKEGVESSYKPAPNECVITSGSQQLLSILADCILNPDDIILIEAPTYFVFMGTLDIYGVERKNIQTDEDGLIPEHLEATLEELKIQGQLHRVKSLYVVDYFQNPTGRSLHDSRMEKIFQIVKKYSTENKILIIEDAAYRPMSFDGRKTHSIKTFDKDNEYVAYVGTYSKSYCPGLKLGFGFLPDSLMGPVLNHKGNQDFGTANFNQSLMCQIIENGSYIKQVHVLREQYIKKSEIMYEALINHLPKEIPIKMPDGGMYFWLKFPNSIPTTRESEFFENCLNNNVLYVPGEFCYYQGEEGQNQLGHYEMRLAYGTVDIKEIEEGVKRLAKSLPQ